MRILKSSFLGTSSLAVSALALSLALTACGPSQGKTSEASDSASATRSAQFSTEPQSGFPDDKIETVSDLTSSGPAVTKAPTNAVEFDIVVLGATPGGIMSAVSAVRHGCKVLLLEREDTPGGLPANGLGATDIATRGATTGLFTEFTGRVRDYYVTEYGESSPQVKDCSDGYHFEPKTALLVFNQMMAECGENLTLLTLRQFDAESGNLLKDGRQLKSLKVTDRSTGAEEWYSAKVFIDATYEGDLGAAAGIPFRVGREGFDEFGEPGAGRVYKRWGDNALGEGSTQMADNAVQAYNYRLCLTDDPTNRIPFHKPEKYDREEYLSMVEDVLQNKHTGLDNLKKDFWGIARVSNMVALPNGKTDANNQHFAFISTDLPEENWPWPTSSWEWRDRFAQRLKEYTQGLLWFAANDKALPKSFRKEISKWGYAADEYEDNGGFPRQVYVREGRRFENRYFFTAADALPVVTGGRPPLHQSSVTSSHYALDSHATRKRETGRVHLDGFLSFPTAPYTVPFEVIAPEQVDNLLLPVPVSGSHIGFSTLRMEPCWMALGQAAGTAASLAVSGDSPVGSIEIGKLQDILLEDGATLVYFKDLKASDPDFALVQKLALRGYFPDWNAELDAPLDSAAAANWKQRSGKSFPTGASRREAVRLIGASLR